MKYKLNRTFECLDICATTASDHLQIGVFPFPKVLESVFLLLQNDQFLKNFPTESDKIK